jgi:hypothetical protein
VSQALTAFEHEFRAVITGGWLEAAGLFQLGALAHEIFARSRGPYSLLAYVLRSVVLDLANHLDGEPVSPDHGRFLKTLNGPIEGAVIGLKGPLAEETATRLAIQLLEGRRSFLA